MRRTFLTICLALTPMTASAAQHASRSSIVPAEGALRGGMIRQSVHNVPPDAWNPSDPADSLYRAARDALNNEDYARAASLFHEIGQRYPKSDYAADAPYWEAFALYRDGGQRNLNRALAALQSQQAKYPKAATSSDAATLATRIRGELARLGEANQAAAVTALADPNARSNRGARRNRSADTTSRAGCPADEDSDIRVAALNALLQMDSERALPILKQVLARRDNCSQGLRRKAVFLVAQKAHSDEGANILLNVARTDPDPEVREQAIFWLSQVSGDRAVAALDSILHSSTDRDLQERAIFALSQHPGDQSAQILRTYAESNAPEQLRGKAIFWLGQMGNGVDNGKYLRDLYARIQNENLKEQIIQALAQSDDSANSRWLFSVVNDKSAPVELRKKALFWAGQQEHMSLNDLLPLYNTLGNRDLQEYFIFVLSQRSEPAATDKLIDIAKHDPNRDMRKKAIFWLSQKDDPRVQQLLMEIINQ
jgi:HEAT repeat protein